MNYLSDNDLGPSGSDAEAVVARRLTNDRFRRSLNGGALFVTPGVLSLGSTAITTILAAVRTYDGFDPADHWDDHAVGDFEVGRDQSEKGSDEHLLFFCIERAAPGAAPILTLLLASEWWGFRGGSLHAAREVVP